MATGKCEFCRKEIQFLEKECDASGLVWHSNCFRCRICKVPLNEHNVRIRGKKNNRLFCDVHAVFEKGFQPVCKIYYLQIAAYRIVF